MLLQGCNCGERYKHSQKAGQADFQGEFLDLKEINEVNFMHLNGNSVVFIWVMGGEREERQGREAS